MKLPGIVVLGFNRPNLLKQCLTALAGNTLATECNLTVYCDGPRNDRDLPFVEATRKTARSSQGFKSLTVVEQQENHGCALSVINGITKSFETHERLAVFEDDVLASPHTLSFLAECLEKYESHSAVFSISAWSPPPSLFKVPKSYPYDAYFVPRCNIWGWAIWKDRWGSVDWAVRDYTSFRKTKALRQAFNYGGSDLSAMLDAQVEGKLDTWDIRMDYSRFKLGCFGINPVISYTTNTGVGSGTHMTEYSSRYDNDLSKATPDFRLPDHVFVDAAILERYQKVYAPPSLAARAVNKGWRLLFGKNCIVA